MFRTTVKTVLTVLLLCAVCLSSVLTSCLYLPDTDPTYDASFYDTYSVEDYNLRHLNANGWDESVIRASSDGERKPYWDKLRVASIPDTDESLFVIGRRSTTLLPLGGAPLEELFIYQSKDAPMPRLDWTVSEIKIFPGYLDTDVNCQTSAYKTRYSDMLSHADILYSWQEDGADPVWAEELKSSFLTVTVKKRERTFKQPANGSYILAITFEENPNIAWFATIYVAHDGYYLERICHNVSYDQEADRFFPMGDTWNLLLEEMLHGMEQFKAEK